MIVVVIVDVAVIANVIVAALVIGDVHVIDTVDATQPVAAAVDTAACSSFRSSTSTNAGQSIPQHIAEGAGRTTRADKAKHFTIARGSAMECAAHLDVMKIDELIAPEHYAKGNELLERVVAMLTRLIDPER